MSIGRWFEVNKNVDDKHCFCMLLFLRLSPWYFSNIPMPHSPTQISKQIEWICYGKVKRLSPNSAFDVQLRIASWAEQKSLPRFCQRLERCQQHASSGNPDQYDGFPLIPNDVKQQLPSQSEVEFVHPHNLGKFNFSSKNRLPDSTLRFARCWTNRRWISRRSKAFCRAIRRFRHSKHRRRPSNPHQHRLRPKLRRLKTRKATLWKFFGGIRE